MKMVKDGLLYTKEHEWAKIQGDTATVGISDYAQEQLGELVFVEPPAVGKEVEQGNDLAVVESSKSASDVYAPLTGKVIEANSDLDGSPELINQDCYGKGWICKIEITDPESKNNLMDSKKYEEYLKTL
jgi:glycine cleavage system H protein